MKAGFKRRKIDTNRMNGKVLEANMQNQRRGVKKYIVEKRDKKDREREREIKRRVNIEEKSTKG